MNKFKTFLVVMNILCFSLLVFFIFDSFIKLYFNEEYYKIPDFRGLTIEEMEKNLEYVNLNFKNMGENFSDYPVGQIFLQQPEAGTVVKRGRKIKVWTSLGKELERLPTLLGKNFLVVKNLAEQNGITIGNVIYIKNSSNPNYNEVLATDPQIDGFITRDTPISFLVNAPEQISNVKMPDIIGMNFNTVSYTLDKYNLIIGNVIYKSIPGIEKNLVIKTNVNAGERIPAGSSIDITVSN